MNQHEKTVKILESFLKDYTMEGVCSFFVDSEEGSEYEEDRIAVYIVLDLDWINKEITKPGFVANRMRSGLKEEIKKYTGLDVYVGSTARKYNESKEMNESVVYNYKKGRNTIPERLPFDVNKLIDAGAIFITPSIDGKPTSKNYKKFLKSKHTHLITLYNLKHSSPDSWVHTAVTRFAPPKHWEGEDFSKNLYDGKYNQILWSLNELGIPYESMLIDEVDENINESISTYLRRRLSFEHMKEDIDNLVDYELNPCEFNDIGDFVAEACDILAHNYLEDLQVSFKDKDVFYINLVDLFGKHLVNVYKERCMKGLKESKKTYMVTESQYSKLLNEQTEEISKENAIKFYKLFKKIVDGKFSELTYNESPYWSTHEDDVAWSNSDNDVIRYNDYTFLVDRDFYWTFMNYLPISHTTLKLMFARYFREKFPNKFFLSVQEFDS